MTQRQIELYIHVPFCKQKCAYCDFLSAPADEETIHRYVRALQRELMLRCRQAAGYEVISIFFGGGTPSLIDARYIEEILDVIRHYYSLAADCEISLELNPGTAKKESMRQYHQMGINGLSIGLQSVDNGLLKALGRIHLYEDFLHTFDLARHAGFHNINVDLMSGIPGQSLEDWQTSLEKVVRLRPTHISAYGLIVEEGTPFYEAYGADEERRSRGEEPLYLPSEETERAMYALTGHFLAYHGYAQYEISNYAKPGYECRHNIGYWVGRAYLGFGIGAASLFDAERSSNVRDLATYCEKLEALEGRSPSEIAALESLAVTPEESLFPVAESVSLTRKDRISEFMFLGLRMTQGVTRADFFNRFGVEIEGLYGDVLLRLSKAGLLLVEQGRVALTEEGVDISNYVLSEFLLDE